MTSDPSHYRSAMALLELLADDNLTIPYRRRLNQITGSVTATIFLQQMIYRWVGFKRRPFWKFVAPCEHAKYTHGESWLEELGFSRWEFEGARKKIGQRIGLGDDKSEALKSALVMYWTDGSRVTWWELNEQLVGKLVYDIYKANEEKPH